MENYPVVKYIAFSIYTLLFIAITTITFTATILDPTDPTVKFEQEMNRRG